MTDIPKETGARQGRPTGPRRPGFCSFYITHKNRFCKFPACSIDPQYCTFHATNEARVPCPLDPNHTVPEAELSQHLKKCNSRPPLSYPPWYSERCNFSTSSSSSPCSDDEEKVTRDDKQELRNVSLDEVMRVVGLSDSILHELSIKTKNTEHSVLDTRISANIQRKHAQQQSSLIGLLRDKKLLHSATVFIEWGAGRAEFSRYINLSLLPPYQSRPDVKHKMILIDRSGVRHKEDHRIMLDTIGAGFGAAIAETMTRREKIDIGDLKLDELVHDFLGSSRDALICSVSKHLCGAATDLTLNCLDRSNINQRGIVIALCCHHRCTYDALHPVSRSFLASLGIRDSEFRVLKGLSGWGVSGLREGMDPSSSGQHWSLLTHLERESIGWRCKRVIDLARCKALQSMGFEAELIQYTARDVSMENIALCATRLSS